MIRTTPDRANEAIPKTVKHHRLFLAAVFAFLALGNFASAKVSPDEFVAACAAGDQAKVEKLLAAGAGVEAPNKLGHSPLLTAMLARKTEVVELLLHRGADPNAVGLCPEEDCGGHPALPLAVYLDDAPIVKLLLAAKADVAWKDHYATRRANLENQAEIFHLLRAAGGRETIAPAREEKPSPAVPLSSGLAELLPAAGKAAAPHATGENLRLAIVADEAMQAAGEVLASELTGGGVQLVERVELDRVLAEQKLSRTFGGDATRAPQVGRLLNADALVLLRKVDLAGRALAELRVVRVSPGIVLGRAHREWPLADVPAWAREAAFSARGLLGKVRPARAVAVSFGEMRSLASTPAGGALAREAALLVVERILRQPDLVLLERSAAAELGREMSIGKPDIFWAGSFLVDGTVEPPLDARGEAAFLLRITPVGGGAPQLFQARGPREKSAAILDGLVAQAAQKLALKPIPQTDPLAEAARYFTQSKAARECGAYLAGYRHAETAAMLGLKTPEFLAARIAAICDVLEWQAAQMNSGVADGSGNWPHKIRGVWAEEKMRACFGDMERLGKEEWLDAAMQLVPLWRELVRGTFAAPTPQGIKTVLDLMPEVASAPVVAGEMLNTVLGQIVFGDRLREIRPAVLAALVEALALADRAPELGEVASRIAISIAWHAPFLCKDERAFQETFRPLFARHFAWNDVPVRTEIRRIVLRYTDVPFAEMRSILPTRMNDWISLFPLKNPAVASIRPWMVSATEGDESDENILFREALRWRSLPDANLRVAQFEKVLTALVERKRLFLEEPFTLRLLNSITHLLDVREKGAPRLTDSGQTRWDLDRYPRFKAMVAEITRAMEERELSIRPEVPREFFLPFALDREPTEFVVRKKFHPPPSYIVKTPSFAHAPPLAVRRSWQPMEALREDGVSFLMSKSTLFCEADRIWFYAENETGRGDLELRAAVFELELPSLRAKVWRLPRRKIPAPLQRQFVENGLCVDAGHIYVARQSEYFAVCDRRSGKWEVIDKIRPASRVYQSGNACYFLAGDANERGFARYTPANGKIEILGSRLRMPATTPLDDPQVTATDLDLGKDGRLIIQTHVKKNALRSVDSFSQTTYPALFYQPANGQWGSADEIASETPSQPYRIPALKKSGSAEMRQETIMNDVWTLQLPNEAMPEADIPLEFLNAPNPHPDIIFSRSRSMPPNPDAATIARYRFLEKRPASIPEGSTECFWTPQGYIITGCEEDYRTLWFLPQSDVDAYLRKYKSSPPAPATTEK